MSQMTTPPTAAGAQGGETTRAIVERMLADVEARLDKGKGTWPKPDYVRDEIWQSWQGEAFALRGVLRELDAAARLSAGGDRTPDGWTEDGGALVEAEATIRQAAYLMAERATGASVEDSYLAAYCVLFAYLNKTAEPLNVEAAAASPSVEPGDRERPLDRLAQLVRNRGPLALWENENGFAFAWGRVPAESEQGEGGDYDSLAELIDAAALSRPESDQ